MDVKSDANNDCQECAVSLQKHESKSINFQEKNSINNLLSEDLKKMQVISDIYSLESLANFKAKELAKRSDFLIWDEYFMSLAFLSAMRSKDPNTQVGVCIINSEMKIVSVGYNGMPIGLSDDEMPWTKGQADPLQNKYYYVCHAELNAVLNKNSADVKNCTLYSTLFPCNECAKVVIQSGIKEVVFFDDTKLNSIGNYTSKIMFFKAGVKIRPFERTGRKINITL